MRHQSILLSALLTTAAVIGSASSLSAWPVVDSAPVAADHIVLAQMGGMGGIGGGGMGGMGGGGMGGIGGGGMGGMGGGGMGGMGGGGMGGMAGGGMGGMGGGMGGMGGGGMRGHNVTRVYVRGVRPWSSRAWYGSVVAGVTLGTIIDTLCWFWIDASQTRGYWDWCVPPP
jgi:hypothetical protein